GWKLAKRHPAKVALVGTLGCAVLSLQVGSLWYNARLQIALQRAEDGEKEARQAIGRLHEKQDDLNKQYELARRSAYNLQLNQVQELLRSDSRRALRLLNDPNMCPVKFREFCWHIYHNLCRQDRFIDAGNSGPIHALAYSDDGKLLATAGLNDDMK